MLISPSNCQFVSNFWIRPDEADAFLVNTHPKCSPGTKMNPWTPEPVNAYSFTGKCTCKKPNAKHLNFQQLRSSGLLFTHVDVFLSEPFSHGPEIPIVALRRLPPSNSPLFDGIRPIKCKPAHSRAYLGYAGVINWYFLEFRHIVTKMQTLQCPTRIYG